MNSETTRVVHSNVDELEVVDVTDTAEHADVARTRSVDEQPSPKSSTSDMRASALKEVLLDMKIYFETLAATALTVMAIVVSTAQYLVANHQTELLRMQLDFQRLEALPQLVIDPHQIPDETGFATEDRIVVYNQGGVAYNASGSESVFFKIESGGATEGITTTEVPVDGYYTAIVRSGSATGLILTIMGNQNNIKASRLRRELRTLAGSTSRFASLDIERYLRISYSDLLSDQHTDYFRVDTVFGGIRLDKPEGEQAFGRYREAISNGSMQQFDQVTAAKLYMLGR